MNDHSAKYSTLAEIERRARAYADKRSILRDRLAIFEDELRSLKLRHLKGIRAGQLAASGAEEWLRIAITDAPGLFNKPKTRLFHGVRCGYSKSKPKLLIADKEKTAELIEKHFPSDYDAFVKTTHAPIVTALSNLTTVELRKIGITKLDGENKVVIKTTDSELERMVEALMAEAREAID